MTMYTTNRTNQGGSVAVFLFVSAVLAAAVIGGVYFVQQRSAQVRTNEPIAQKETPKQNDKQTQTDADKRAADEQAKKRAEEKKQAEQKQQEQQKAATAAREKAEQQKQQADAAKKAEADKQAAATAEAEKNRQQQKQPPATTQAIPQTGVATTPTTGHLPQTGPEDALPQIISGAVLVAVLLAYLKSYRHRFGSLLR